MNSKAVMAVLMLVLLAGVGGVVWFLNTGTDEPSLETAKEGTSSTASDATKDTPAVTPRRQNAAIGAVWKLRGKGALVGRLLEYGTEKPVSGLAIRLVANGGPDTTLSAASLADGTFSFLDVPNFDQWTLEVAAKAPFREIAMPLIAVVENQQTDVGTIYLAPSFVVKGSVINDNGAGVEGVTVLAQRVGGADSRFDIMKLIRELGTDVAFVDSAVTAKDGSFELTKTPPGTYDFLLTSETYAARSERSLPITPDSEKRPLRFTVTRGYELEGRVVRKDGGSPAKIRIVAMTNPDQDRSFLNPTKVFTVSDDLGNFKFRGLPLGRVIVAAAVPDRPMAMNDDVRLPQTGFAEVVVGGEASIVGRVVDENGQPIVGAELSMILQRRSPTIASARSDENGSYEMVGLPLEKAQMMLVKADGFAPYPDDMSMMMRGPRGSQADELKPGRNERNFTLKRGAIVRGIVKTKDGGKPIEGARVTVVGMAAMFSGTPGATTGPDGKFEIRGVGKGQALVTATKDGFQGTNPSAGMMAMMVSAPGRSSGNDAEKPQGAIDVKEFGAEIEVTLELSLAPILSGRVVDPEGRPVVGARISAQRIEKDEAMGRGFREMMAMATPATRFSDSEGRFEIAADGEKGAAVEVVAQAPGFVESKSTPQTVNAGEKIGDISVVMRRGGTIEGRVVAENGNPVEGATVRWMKDGRNAGSWGWDRSSNASATTNAEGKFTLSTIEPGKVSVRATAKGLAAAFEHDVAIAEDSKASLTLTMVRGLSISGRAVDTSGQPIPRARINHWIVNDKNTPNWSGGFEDVRTSQDGTFEIAGLSSAEFEVYASHDDYADSDRRKVASGTTGIEFVMQKAQTIKGKVFSNGTPVAGIRVSATREGDENNTSRGSDELTGPDGSFVIDRLAPGVYTIKAEPNWWMNDIETPNVMPGKVSGILAGAENVIINVEPGVIISGQVMRADGGSPDEATVNASSDFSGEESTGDREYIHRSARVKNGRFEVRGLRPGKYSLQIEISEYSSKRLRIEAPATNVTVTLGGGCRVGGRIVREDGTPMAGVYVSFYCETGGDGSTRSRDDGTFTITGLDAGKYQVSAWGDNQSGRLESAIDIPASGQLTLPDITIQNPKPKEDR